MIRKVLFLIGNRHFLIRKCHFGISAGPYVERWSVRLPTLPTFRRCSHDPPQTTHRRHRRRFRRPRRLLGHDCSEERRLPGANWFIDLQVSRSSAKTIC